MSRLYGTIDCSLPLGAGIEIEQLCRGEITDTNKLRDFLESISRLFSEDSLLALNMTSLRWLFPMSGTVPALKQALLEEYKNLQIIELFKSGDFERAKSFCLAFNQMLLAEATNKDRHYLLAV